jgi:hypothetical protein
MLSFLVTLLAFVTFLYCIILLSYGVYCLFQGIVNYMADLKLEKEEE